MNIFVQERDGTTDSFPFLHPGHKHENKNVEPTRLNPI